VIIGSFRSRLLSSVASEYSTDTVGSPLQMTASEELISLGAKVHFYQKGFIHSKMVLVDNEVASVGTANMDIRSFMLNSEINAFIYDDETVQRLYQVFYEDIKDCRPVTQEDIAKKSFVGKLWQSFCRLFSPVM